ncbi:MAG: cobalamin B12-binding domain-containing protein [Deltaproteobacteria bacterium]|nr:cobalamin B12-binding domain-containing protein [Deltaproteobacteria bacterium]MBW2032100.1 cobalamin B12-binding domain-containing protein [Deltaproteobacteria bacterium]
MEMRDENIRILVAKIGLDGHDRGGLIIAQALKNAGMEVIYTGLKNTSENVVEMAIQEDVDIIGISILSGAHLVLMPILMDELKKNNADDIPVIVGGVIPPGDIPKLKAMNVREVFPAGSQVVEAVAFIRRLVQERRKSTRAS